eukprot:s2818_g6.t3
MCASVCHEIVLELPKTLVAKDVNEEGGMGIHVLKNVLHGGNWLLQEKLFNHPDVAKLLPKESPLSTMRVARDPGLPKHPTGHKYETRASRDI